MNTYIEKLVKSFPIDTTMEYIIRNSDIKEKLGMRESSKANKNNIDLTNGEIMLNFKLYLTCLKTKNEIEKEIIDEDGDPCTPVTLSVRCADGNLIAVTPSSLDSYLTEFFELLDGKTKPTAKKFDKFVRIFSHYFFQYVRGNNIDIFNKDNAKIESESALYAYLLLALKETDKLRNIRWNELIKSNSQKCKYLFNIDKENVSTKSKCITAVNKLNSDWSGVNFDIKLLIPSRDKADFGGYVVEQLSEKYASPIIKEALKHPLLRYYFATDKAISGINTPYTHALEVRELLMRITRLTPSEDLLVDSPITATIQYIRSSCNTFCKNYEFTAQDFLLCVGWLAEEAQSSENHIISDGIAKLDSDTPRIFKDVDVKEIIEAVRKLNFLIDGEKFKVRSYRLICAAYYSAYILNQMSLGTDDELNAFLDKAKNFLSKYLTKYTGDLIVLGDDFYRNMDVAAFYGVSLLSFLDSRHRETLLVNICDNEASDFSVRNRATQTLYIYLLVNILVADDIELSGAMRKMLFECTFGKTLYSFQVEQFKYISKNSQFYRNEIERSVKESLTLNDQCAAKAPIYGFICGQTEGKNATVWAKWSDIQFNTFSNYQSNSEYKEKVNTALVEAKKEFIDYTINEKNLQYALGVHMLAYAISDMVRSAEGKTEGKIGFNDFCHSTCAGWTDRVDILSLFIRADYITRATSIEYNATPPNYEDLYLPCGIYRVVCSCGLENLDIKVEFTDEIAGRYRDWLQNELNANHIRYAMLLSRLLNCTNFYTEYNNGDSRLPTLSEIIAAHLLEIINPENPILLPYDKFDQYIKDVKDGL